MRRSLSSTQPPHTTLSFGSNPTAPSLRVNGEAVAIELFQLVPQINGDRHVSNGVALIPDGQSEMQTRDREL